MSSAFLALAFALGVLAGAAGAVLVRLGSERAGDVGRRRFALKIAAMTALGTIALTVVAGYGIVRWKFRKRPVTGVSVEQAVKQFRQVQIPAGAGETGKAPAAGVYTYVARGGYELEVPVVGKDRRELRAQTTATVVPVGRCWELTIRFFSQHSWMAHYCASAAVPVAMVFWRARNEYFGRKLTWSYECAPPDTVRAPAQVGATWTQRCKTRLDDGGEPKTVQLRVAGRESLTVDGKPIACVRVTRTITSLGRQSGRTVRDLWFAEATGMLVRLREHSASEGMASFRSDFDLVLASPKPVR